MTKDRAWLARNFRQFLKFGIVGGSGVIVNLAVGILLHRANGGTINAGDPLFSLPGTDFAFRYRNFVWVGSFLVANLWNYQLNRWWTFRGHAVGWWRGFWPFLAVGSVAMIVGLGIQWALTHPGTPLYLGADWFTEDVGLRSREYWAQIIAILVTTPINFVVNKLWTFRRVGRRGGAGVGVGAAEVARAAVAEPAGAGVAEVAGAAFESAGTDELAGASGVAEVPEAAQSGAQEPTRSDS